MSPHLSFDIQVEIIKSLPVKSLIQFRSVCKSWKSMIDSSQFIAGYNFHHDQSEHLVIRYKDWEEGEVKYVSFVDDDSFSFSFPQQKLDLTIPPIVQATTTVISSSHGLLCLSDYFQEPDSSCRTKMAVLWNPTIRKSISIVVPSSLHPPFDYVLGFWVCPVTKDPKLVKITYISDQSNIESISCIPFQVMVFTLSSGEWTTPCTNMPRKSIEFTDFQTLIGQFFYWLVYDRIDVVSEHRNLIMSFDMSSEEFREIDLPDCLAEMPQSYMEVSKLRESLVLIVYIRSTLNKQACDLWMMEHGDPKAFTKLFTISTPDASVAQTLGFRKNGEPIIELQDDKDFEIPCALVVFEPFSQHIRDLGICGISLFSFANRYTESLLLLDHDDGHIVRCGAVKS